MVMDLLTASRPISWVNTAYPFAAAYLLAGADIDWIFVVGSFFFLFPYNLLMYGINDIFDYESDRRNPRKGGIEGALLSKEHHRVLLWSALICSLPFAVLLLWVGQLQANIVLLISLAAVVAYSAPKLRFKERPLLDSITSATHFVSPAVYGWTLAGAPISTTQWAVFGAFMLWGIASHALGAIQDILPDRQGGINSIATVFSARGTIWLVLAAYIASGWLTYASLSGPAQWAAVLALPYIANILPHLQVDDERSGTVNEAWKRFLWINYLCGFGLTMLLIYLLLLR